MKKIAAILLAVIFAMSVSIMAFADAEAKTEATNVCDFCGEKFDTVAELTAHIEATFPTYATDTLKAHEKICENHCDKDFDGVEECCDEHFTTKAAYEAHQTNCQFKDTASSFDKAVGYFQVGNAKLGFSNLGKAIVDFFKSETFKNAISKVLDVVKGIDLGGVVDTVKNVAGIIPFDKIGDAVKGLF